MTPSFHPYNRCRRNVPPLTPLLAALCLLTWCCASLVPAREPDEPGLRTIRAARAGQAPEIDGLLDDACWQDADWQGDFIQLKPSPGEPARARTRVAVACDDTHLYVAFRCFNPPENQVNSKINRRDGNMDTDNAVTLYLDSFHTRRDCYYFSTNSLGTQVDGRIGEDGGANDKNWDCTWQVKSREDSLGWTAEMAIPVNEIRFPEGEGHTWGINFRRNYPVFFETSFWTERDAAWRISRSGDLVGLGGFRKKFSAALYPYIVSLNSNTPSSGRKTVYSSGGTEVISGADLKFDLGATVNGNLTYNPDFATVEADLEVINLTRYETFYPEKRLYFLEGAELFSTRFNVFHSRRIGDIDLGLKTNGRLGDFNFAALSAHERAAGGRQSSLTSVFRLQKDVLGKSNIGLSAVDRSWDGEYNRVYSTDATINFGRGYRVETQYAGSFASGGEFESAYFAQLSRDVQLYNYHFTYTNIDPGFRENVNPVGFIQDDDRRMLDFGGGHEQWIRRYGIDKINSNINGNVFWSHSGALRNVEAGGWVGVT
ncbi:MAG: carbohydrate binding family 9 domain-containing protein, partial [Candidatus Glassbacteria bacterium]|nr:carbohydrate binding family 9 domain-containing protein [Candidatus Glassbacteria bacterium]